MEGRKGQKKNGTEREDGREREEGLREVYFILERTGMKEVRAAEMRRDTGNKKGCGRKRMDQRRKRLKGRGI